MNGPGAKTWFCVAVFVFFCLVFVNDELSNERRKMASLRLENALLKDQVSELKDKLRAK